MIALWPIRHRSVVAGALALILLGSLFPRGYMPVHESNRIIVALCSASGPQKIAIDLGGKSLPRRHSGSSNCWGVFAGAALLPGVAPLAAPPPEWPMAAPVAKPRTALVRLFHFDPNAPPQAPPGSAI